MHTLHTAEVFKVKQSISRCLKISKSLIQHYERSELRSRLEWTKVDKKKKPNIWSIWWGFGEIFLGDFHTM